MSRIRVKICGITRLDDALLACELGADALGFNFWPQSRRYVAPAVARDIVAQLPPFVVPVGVFVNKPLPEILSVATMTQMQLVQFHGDESPEQIDACPLPSIRAVRVSGTASVADLGRYRVRAVLLDAPGPGYGGSGTTFDWDLASEVARQRPVILAGGLTPGNVARAVRAVRPYAIDVASGVEIMAGVKDPEKMRAFIDQARQEGT